MAINGARSIKSLVTDTSDLDANTGIAYRGKSLYECQRELPKAKGGSIALPEAAFWLLLTGEVPTDSETAAFTQELHRRSDVPPNVMATINTLPTDTHPMTQLAIGMLAMQKHSKFAAKYDEGMKKPEYWEWSLEDSLDLAAKIPVIAATIYRRTFADGKVPAYDSKLDWAANYGNMLGISQDPEFFECMRLYLMLHADHEGGNVSAHTTGLVGSALSDPYYSWAAGLCGLAGPLHGLANQECLEWLMEVQKELKGETPTEANVSTYVEKTLKAGKVIPGFGHAVLRKPDPRYMLEREFALQHCKNDPLFQLVDVCFKTIPPMLEKKGKVKNPYPNVDAHSGQLMYYYKLRDPRYYTVIFAVSRALGCVAQLVWARAIGLPIERPKSVPLDVLQKLASQAK
jgi:citrate synthase